MSVSIGELKGIITLSDQFSGPIDKVAKSLGMTSQSFTAVTQFAGLAVGAIGAATAAVVALGSRGADVADVRSAFDGFSEAAGASADVMLGKLQEGTLGTISNFDLMKLANKALGAGLVKSADDMGTLAEGAQLLADRTGGSAKEAFETLTSTIATGRTAGLKQLGLFVDTKVATEEYAKSLGKSAGALTDAERAQALSTGTLKVLREQLDANGKAQADFGDNVQKARVFVANFTDNLGEAIATSPVVKAGMDAIGKALQDAFGGTQQDTIKTLMGFVNQFAIGLTYVAQVGVTAATVIVTAWYGIKTVVLGVITSVAAVGDAIVHLVGGLAEMGTHIPLVGDKLKGFAAGAFALGAATQGMTRDLAAQTAEAARGVVGNSDAQRSLDKLGGAVLTVRSALQAQVGASALATKAHQEMGAGAERAATVTAEQYAKIEAASQTLQQELALAQTTGIENRLLELTFGYEREIAALDNLKGLTLAKRQELVDGIGEKYDLMAQQATDSSAEILAITQQLDEELAAVNQSALDQKLAQIDAGYQAEIAKIEAAEVKYGEHFDWLKTKALDTYSAMAAAAIAAHDSIEARANAEGFQTREQLQQTAAAAQKTYEDMLASGKFNADALEAAHQKAEEAKRKASDDTKTFQLTAGQALVQGTQQIFSVLGEKHKSAAIAGAIINTYQAIAKALASAPWPFSLVLAAGAAAAGWANVSKIRSSDIGWAEGTPGTAFVDFGRGSTEVLHGQEAVINKAQGATLAGMIGDEIRDARSEGGRGGETWAPAIHIQIGPQEIRDFQVREMRAGLQPAR